MNIDKAARATRKYWSAPHWEYQDVYFADHAGCDPENVGALYGSCAEAQAACDRLNLIAVLEAIKPQDGQHYPGGVIWAMQNLGPPHIGASITSHINSMIDALIAEVKE